MASSFALCIWFSLCQAMSGGPPRDVRREPLESEAAGGQVSSGVPSLQERALLSSVAPSSMRIPTRSTVRPDPPKIVEFGHVGWTTEDEGPLPRGHGHRHVTGDASGPGVDGGGELARREVEGQELTTNGRCSSSLPRERPRRFSLRSLRTLDAHEVEDGQAVSLVVNAGRRPGFQAGARTIRGTFVSSL